VFIAATPFPLNKNIVSDETHLVMIRPLLRRRVLLILAFVELNSDS
jgi:hypothetical protein